MVRSAHDQTVTARWLDRALTQSFRATLGDEAAQLRLAVELVALAGLQVLDHVTRAVVPHADAQQVPSWTVCAGVRAYRCPHAPRLRYWFTRKPGPTSTGVVKSVISMRPH